MQVIADMTTSSTMIEKEYYFGARNKASQPGSTSFLRDPNSPLTPQGSPSGSLSENTGGHDDITRQCRLTKYSCGMLQMPVHLDMQLAQGMGKLGC